MPPSSVAFTPSRLSSKRKFTTPATASDPYAAEAPPVTMSTPSMSACGMAFVSTGPSRIPETKRLPSTSVSVRCAPRPRRSSMFLPALATFVVLVAGVSVARSWGSRLSASATLGRGAVLHQIAADDHCRSRLLESAPRDARSRNENFGERLIGGVRRESPPAARRQEPVPAEQSQFRPSANFFGTA